MFNRAHTLLKDERRDLRIKDAGRVRWEIKYKQREGSAKILDISTSGMQVETDVGFDPKDECILSFGSRRGDENYIPKIGRLVWHKKKKFSRSKYLSGIKFMEADEDVLKRMRRRVHEGAVRFLKRHRITTGIGLVLCAVCIALISFILWLSGMIYQDINLTNEKILQLSQKQMELGRSYALYSTDSGYKLAEVTRKLNIANQLIQEDKAERVLFAQELEATKALLNQTENMLIQYKNQSAEFQREIIALKSQGPKVSKADQNVETAEDAYALIKMHRDELRKLQLKLDNLKSQPKSGIVQNGERQQSNDAQSSTGNGKVLTQAAENFVPENQEQRQVMKAISDTIRSRLNPNSDVNKKFFE